MSSSLSSLLSFSSGIKCERRVSATVLINYMIIDLSYIRLISYSEIIWEIWLRDTPNEIIVVHYKSSFVFQIICCSRIYCCIRCMPRYSYASFSAWVLILLCPSYTMKKDYEPYVSNNFDNYVSILLDTLVRIFPIIQSYLLKELTKLRRGIYLPWLA